MSYFSCVNSCRMGLEAFEFVTVLVFSESMDFNFNESSATTREILKITN